MKIHLIRGFTLHGKTTFAKDLSQKLNCPILSFANHLKNEVKKYLYELCNNDEFEKYSKDKILPECFHSMNCKTLRDYYKSFALKNKRDNPYFYAEKLYEECCEKGYSEVIIDDFRFPEEYEYLVSFQENKLFFYRIFDPQGKIPDENDISEHSLDYFKFKDEQVILRDYNL